MDEIEKRRKKSRVSIRSSNKSESSFYSASSVPFAEEYVAMNQEERRKSLKQYARRKSSIGAILKQVSSTPNNVYKSLKKRLSITPKDKQSIRRRSSVRAKNGIDRPLIESVRKYVLDSIDLSDVTQYHENDINLICSTDDMICRFLKEYLKNRDLERVLDQDVIIAVGNSILETLKWRQKFGIHNLKSSNFPRELFQSGLISVDLVSYHEPIVYIDCGAYAKIPGCTEIYLDFVYFSLIKIMDQKTEYRKISVIADCAKQSFSNVDVPFLASFVPSFLKHFPQTVSFFWILNLPWYARGAGYVITKLIPDKIKSMNTETAIKELGEEIMSSSFGGKNKTSIAIAVPDDASDLETVAKAYKLSPASISRWKKFSTDINL